MIHEKKSNEIKLFRHDYLFTFPMLKCVWKNPNQILYKTHFHPARSVDIQILNIFVKKSNNLRKIIMAQFLMKKASKGTTFIKN